MSGSGLGVRPDDDLPHFSQFRRPDGRPWPATRFKNGKVKNLNGSNCWATGATLGIWHARGGRFTHEREDAFQCTGDEPPTPPRVRFWSNDRMGGGGLAEIARAAAHWGIEASVSSRSAIEIDYGAPIEKIERKIAAGMIVLMQTDYEAIRDRFSCAASFDDGHHLVLRRIGERDFGDGLGPRKAGRVSDSLCDSPRWIPWPQIVAALEGYSGQRDHGVAAFVRRREETMATIDYVRDRFCSLAPATPMRDEPGGTVLATVGSSASRIPLLSFTSDRKWAQVGITSVADEPIGRPLFVRADAVDDVRVEATPPSDPAAQDVAARIGRAVEEARRQERAKLEATVEARTADLRAEKEALERRLDALRDKFRSSQVARQLEELLADLADD